jgi:hypothetical protein
MHQARNFQTKSAPYFLKGLLVAILFFWFSSVEAATLSVSPSTGVYTAGSSFTVKVTVNTAGVPVNAADGTISFNPSELTVQSVSKGSIFNLWTAEPTFSNTAGTISFSGGNPTGYTGSNGSVLSVTFRSKAAGSPKVSFSSGSVLAADGKGTNVLTKMNGGAFTITAQDTVPAAEVVEYVAPANTPAAPKVESATHPDQSKWYTLKTAELSWSIPSGVTQMRTLLDTNPNSIPTKVYESPSSKLTLSDLTEGVQYFHIQFKNADGWGKVSHYRIAIDTEKPSKFEVRLQENADLSNPSQKVLFVVEDAQSKVKNFKIKIDDKEPIDFLDETGSSSTQLPALEPGYHAVIVEAFDEAGNSIINSLSFTILAFEKPTFTEFPNRINDQVIPVIKGLTRPLSKVEVTVTTIGLGVSSAHAMQSQEVVSDEKGVFAYIPNGTFAQGVYELTAVATDQYGARSGVSDPIRIVVEAPGYIKLGVWMVSLLSVLIPLLALIACMILGLLFIVTKFRLFKRGVSKEANEAHKILTREFLAIQAAVAYQKNLLQDSKKTKKLTKIETEIFDSFSKSIEVSKEKVLKEIVDIEDISK